MRGEFIVSYNPYGMYYELYENNYHSIMKEDDIKRFLNFWELYMYITKNIRQLVFPKIFINRLMEMRTSDTAINKPLLIDMDGNFSVWKRYE